MFNFLGGLYSKPYGRHVVTYYVAVLLVALMVAPVLFNGHPMEFELKFSFFLLVCLVWWWGNGLLLLFAVQAFLVVVEPRGMQSTYAWMVALLGGTLVILVERFKSLKRYQQDYARVEEKAQSAEQLAVKEDGESPIVDGLLPEASPETKAVMHPLRVVVVSVATAVLAVFLLECVPLFPNANSRVGLLPAEFRMLMICFLLFMAYLATWVIWALGVGDNLVVLKLASINATWSSNGSKMMVDAW